MITYSSSDIIKRAMQLADLENSDFITFSEEIALLNEAYTGMYQRVINRGDNSFLRIINTQSSVIELPPDFWQLKAINVNTNGYLQQVLRRPANQTVNYLSYDIMNNTLVINGNTMGATVNIEYYPIPTTLTFPAKPKELMANNIVDMHSNYYLTADSTKYILHDNSDSSINIEIEVNPTTYNRIHMEDDYISFVSSSSSYVYFNLLTGEKYTISSAIPTIYKGKTFCYKNNKLYFIDSNTIAFEDVPVIATTGLKTIIMSDDMEHYIAIKLNGDLVVDGEVEQLKKPVYKLHKHNDDVYCTTNSEYIAKFNFTDKSFNEEIADKAIMSIINIDPNTGYGFLAKQLGNKFSVMSYLADTELNFPNNIYYTMLAYMLAIAFKTKQGADVTQLSMLLDSAENAFYDTMERDDWGAVRITNAY